MKCDHCELIVKFNKLQLSDFFNRESPQFESLLTPKIRNLRPHHSHPSREKCNPTQRHTPVSLL